MSSYQYAHVEVGEIELVEDELVEEELLEDELEEDEVVDVWLDEDEDEDEDDGWLDVLEVEETELVLDMLEARN